jgi:hypothetical protein
MSKNMAKRQLPNPALFFDAPKEMRNKLSSESMEQESTRIGPKILEQTPTGSTSLHSTASTMDPFNEKIALIRRAYEERVRGLAEVSLKRKKKKPCNFTPRTLPQNLNWLLPGDSIHSQEAPRR